MPIESAWNMYVFRDGKSLVRGELLMHELMEVLRRIYPGSPFSDRGELIDALLRAGELECALADTGSAQEQILQKATDELASALVYGRAVPGDDLLRGLNTVAVSERVKIGPPEGFAYYALHPLDFCDLLEQLTPRAQGYAVLGIRSIGTTLSAVVKAGLEKDGAAAERITVRPTGHPYNREIAFTSGQSEWVREMALFGREFLVVDEGPGMSGSSFLSVGEALVAAGVPRTSITFLASREPDPDKLTTDNGAARWRSFRSTFISPTRHLPRRAKKYVAGGIWRGMAFSNEADWPASWTQMETLKFLSEDGCWLFKFEGFGRFGREVHRRASLVASAGFGPAPEASEEGFGVYPIIQGRYLGHHDASETVLRRIADYCAWRSVGLATDAADNSALATMLRFNFQQEFVSELPAEVSQLVMVRPVIADGRMAPHKWLQTERDVLKIDSAAHGDNHFLPGPTDIAWDLAGTIVEWTLGEEAARFFIDCYGAASGDDPSERLPSYLLAYSVFRSSYCKMASAAMIGSYEEERLLCDYKRYRGQAAEYMANFVDRNSAQERVA